MSNPDYKFCPRCTTPLIHEDRYGAMRAVCPNCKWIHFADPKVAAAVLVEQNARVLLVRRVGEPFRGFWTLPAGFVNSREDPAAAASRECLEETGLTVRVTRVIDIIAGREHPTGADFVIVYQAEIIGGEMTANDDADAVEWFDKNNLPPLAFRATQKVLESFYA
ncbi:MAG TPA: NUDIX hydrolase [Anaerolineales bacterium]|nr:NUDIX hydrolase [Anaerolineales bacterium]